MLAQLHPSFLIAGVFFLISIGYIIISLHAIAINKHSNVRQEYFVSVMCVVLSSLLYGIMTIAENDTVIRTMWTAGFISFFLFLPTWIRFTSNMVTYKNGIIRLIVRHALIIISAILAVLCVTSNDVTFIRTSFGNQFSYQGSLIFRIVGIYVFLLCIIVIASHFNWWRESKTERQRRQQYRFVALTTFLLPIGYVTDFVIPAFTEFTITPFVSIFLFPAALLLFISMRINRTLSITISNVSGYIFKSVTIPSVVLDSENKIRLMNNAAYEFFGSDLIGTDIAEVVLIDEKTPDPAFFESDYEKKVVTVETPTGINICEMLLTVERDKYAEALCKVVILRDITENEYLIKKMQDTSHRLEIALTHANAASKAKSNFLSNMSHEMRTPMNAIIGMTAIGERAESIEDKNHALSRIRDASSHLLGVINDVLDMAKIEANKLELAHVPFDFNTMLDKVLAVVTFSAAEKLQELKINIDEKMPHVIVGDDQHLAQVLTNILANAIKFTPEEGHITLDVTIEKELAEMYVIRFEITDTGLGISEEQQNKLFRPFHQVESGISRDYEGTGLGLTISKNIIELMGGEIWVESELGKGARFIFTIKTPRESDAVNDIYEMDKAYSAPSITSEHTAKTGEFAGKNILIVEDIAINREILITLLESTGVSIDVAENGKQALDMITARPEEYDLVLMDMQMPQMDGLEATRRIRALSSQYSEKLPIIAISANVFTDDIEACLEAGMDDHLGKPLDFNKVLAALRKYLK